MASLQRRCLEVDAEEPLASATRTRNIRFHVFDAEDPIIAAYRDIFPHLFRDASAMPAALCKHVRYPELMLQLQAARLRSVSHDRSRDFRAGSR
jgi:uncharacterized membrane protein (UPF0182 family)